MLSEKAKLIDVSLEAHIGTVLDAMVTSCLLYTSDAADDLLCVDLGGSRIIKKTHTSQQLIY